MQLLAGRSTRSDQSVGALTTAVWCSPRSTVPIRATRHLPIGPTSGLPREISPRFAWGYVANDVQDEQRDELRPSAALLGVKLVPVEPPNLKKDYGLPKNELAAGLMACESGAAFEDLTRRGEPKGVKGWTPWFLLGNTFLAAVDYLEAQPAAGHRHAAI